MTNLFSIFDPSTPNFFSSNWASTLLFILLFPLSMWVLPNRYKITLIMMLDFVYNEFSPIVKKTIFILLMSLSLFIFIMFNNVMGLFPYIFTSSSHMVYTLTMALTAWLSLIIYGWLNNTSNLLVHLIPQGTPYILIPFMVIIETISNIIRPATLAIRLTANMIAGHLLITLLSSATPLTPLYLIPVMFMAQIALSMLEIAVAFIQAYVFSVLMTLYIAEATD
uniref:ATP synthase subunit a n=1 Tax=Parhyale hawaiensis TaxID=317513 RepID=Q6DVI9_9CRUS|nr:ATP synthase F0 subunit 6 [Parhyale hawaiensis]AAT69310.1 ATP synthase F0 subunit 6 [Parhyale hawaiensis]AYB71605.1 ATP synthase F0 subunit 6 [Parhyale hawaiensis]